MDELTAFKYCPRCKGNFVEKDKTSSCTVCGLTYYGNSRPCAVGILINEKGEHLLVYKAEGYGEGLWDFPGGFAERGETLEECVTREIKEELSVKISSWEYLGSYADQYEYQEVRYPTVIAVFKTKVKNDIDIRLGEELADWRFCALKDIDVQKAAFPYSKEVIKALKAGGEKLLS